MDSTVRGLVSSLPYCTDIVEPWLDPSSRRLLSPALSVPPSAEVTRVKLEPFEPTPNFTAEVMAEVSSLLPPRSSVRFTGIERMTASSAVRVISFFSRSVIFSRGQELTISHASRQV